VNWKGAISTYRGHTVPHLKLIQHRNWWFAISGAVIFISIVGLIVRGLNYSIEFKGGAQITYDFKTAETVPEITSILAKYGRGDAEIQVVNGQSVSIRTQSLTDLSPDEQAALKADLAKQAGISSDDVNTQDVGPTWGSQISKKAIRGLIVVLILITGYIAVRFEWKMALGAMIALVHDLINTAGIYALVGREVTPATVIAILTILGFSLYDTVVIYDKIQENTESTALVARLGYSETVNQSCNQVFMRSVNTSLVVLLPILSLLFFGGATLKDFAFAMFVGVTTGAYSSIFVAAPVLTVLKEREPRYRQIEARRAVRDGGPRPKALAAPAATDGAAASNAAATAATAKSAPRPSRPRPKSKRKPPAKRKRR
jgi:preprotein translocase subunit SecF